MHLKEFRLWQLSVGDNFIDIDEIRLHVAVQLYYFREKGPTESGLGLGPQASPGGNRRLGLGPPGWEIGRFRLAQDFPF